MFELVENDEKFDLQMSATLELIDKADDRLAAFLKEKHWPVDLFAVRILLRESLLNAVTHGSGKDPNKNVSFELAKTDEGVEMRICDSGPGFEWQDRDRDHEVEVLSDGGRGIALMEIYADELKYNDVGNELVLKKCFTSQSAAR